jgi:uncharacterized protein YutE (UPF0331/DUF86 family)
MTDPEIVLERLRHLQAALARIREKNPQTQQDLFSNPDVQDVVLRNMQNALQSALDISSHIVSDEGWGTPVKAADFFQELAGHQVISSELASTMIQLIKFRNILVHEYTKLDLSKTWDAVSTGAGKLQSFGQAISQWLSQRP